MALPSSGTLSLSDIASEFGGSTPHSLSEYYGAASGIPSSGTISISDFYGASNAPSTYTILNYGSRNTSMVLSQPYYRYGSSWIGTLTSGYGNTSKVTVNFNSSGAWISLLDISSDERDITGALVIDLNGWPYGSWSDFLSTYSRIQITFRTKTTSRQVYYGWGSTELSYTFSGSKSSAPRSHNDWPDIRSVPTDGGYYTYTETYTLSGSGRYHMIGALGSFQRYSYGDWYTNIRTIKALS